MNTNRILTGAFGLIGALFFGYLSYNAYSSPNSQTESGVLLLLLGLTALFLIIAIFGPRVNEIPVPGIQGNIVLSASSDHSPEDGSDHTKEDNSSGAASSPSVDSKNTSKDRPFDRVLKIAREESTEVGDILGEIRRQSDTGDPFAALLVFLESSLTTPSEDLERSIANLDRKIAVKEYVNGTTDPSMDIVDYHDGTIRAKATQPESLTKGMRFNVLVEDSRLNESVAVGVAEMTQPDSTTGMLYELELVEEGGQEPTLPHEIERKLVVGDGTIRVQENELTDIAVDRLKQARGCLSELQREKQEREISYAS